jgi:hypothetical protein
VAENQYELCVEVLRRLERAGILKHIILAGSWCTLFYREYFAGVKYAVALKTRDMDLVIPQWRDLRMKVDVAELLKDLGFIVGFTGAQGYIRLEHPKLIVEFLVPEKGRGSDKPFPLPQLGINAQALRFLDFLARNTLTVKLEEITITLPHPADFALHKLMVLGRRPMAAKKLKDKESAIRILEALIQKGDEGIVRKEFLAMSLKWRKKILNTLADCTNKKITDIFQ